MIVHGLENANMPTVFRDWDMEKGSVKDHKRRQTRVLLEMLLMMVVRTAFHAIMLLPIIFTGKYHIDTLTDFNTSASISKISVGKTWTSWKHNWLLAWWKIVIWKCEYYLLCGCRAYSYTYTSWAHIVLSLSVQSKWACNKLIIETLIFLKFHPWKEIVAKDETKEDVGSNQDQENVFQTEERSEVNFISLSK